jgi:hypothetical protein
MRRPGSISPQNWEDDRSTVCSRNISLHQPSQERLSHRCIQLIDYGFELAKSQKFQTVPEDCPLPKPSISEL